MTLRRKRIRSSTPPSLVKFAARLSSVTMAWSSSTPTSDHVPQATYANGASPAGTPTIADAVSCDPTRVRSVSPDAPVSARMSSRSGPMTSPGAPSSVNRPVGRPSEVAMSSRSQRRRWTSSRAVVDALVTSVTRMPDSQ